jgi:integrase
MGRKKARLYLRNTTWWCWFYGTHGERVSLSTHQRDRALAQTVAARIERDHFKQPEGPQVSLRMAIAQFMDSRERKGCAPATIAYYEKQAKRLPEALMERDINGLRMADLEAYQDARRKGGAGKNTVAKVLGMVLSALRLAERHGQFVGHVAQLRPEGLENAYVPRDRSLSRVEYRKLARALRGGRTDYLAAFVALGVRDSELYAITAADVDLKRGVHVRGTKTAKSDRWIPIDKELRPVLVRRMAGNAGPLFPRWSNVRRDLHAGCKRASVAPVSPNDLRRTFASWLCQDGVNETTCAQLMGHSSSAMVRRVYMQAGPEAMRRAIRGLRLPVAAGVAVPTRKGGRSGLRG